MDVMDLENIDADAPIFDTAKAQGTSIRDHLVIGRKGHTSFKNWAAVRMQRDSQFAGQDC